MAFRSPTRVVSRDATRSATGSVWRTVLPYDGPTLEGICRLLAAYIRLAEKHERKKQPRTRQPKWQPMLSPEESQRKFMADMERCYGDATMAAREQPLSPSIAPASPQPASSLVPPAPAEPPDVRAVPIRRTPGGLLYLDRGAAQ